MDEYIAPDNPVRSIDAFVDQLSLRALGFQRVVAASEGRPASHPADLLKLSRYGYRNRVRSSRCLERETHRNLEVMWVLKKLTPDHKTIADFGKDNLKALKAVCCEFTPLGKRLGLLGGELVAIEGRTFKAVNNRKRNFNPQKLERATREVERKSEGFLKELDQSDKEVAERACGNELDCACLSYEARAEPLGSAKDDRSSGISQRFSLLHFSVRQSFCLKCIDARSETVSFHTVCR